MTTQAAACVTLRAECYMNKRRDNRGVYNADLPEDALLQKWPKLLGLQIDLASARDEEKGTAGKGVTADCAKRLLHDGPVSGQVVEAMRRA